MINPKLIIGKYKSLPLPVKASFWFLICAFLQRGISALTTPIFTRMLSTAEYGQYNVFNSWYSIINCFVTLNLYGGMFTQKLIKEDDSKKASFSSSMQGLCFSLVLFWTVVYLLFHKQINSLLSLSTTQMGLMFLIMWTASIFNLWAMWERTQYKYKTLVVITLVFSIANPILGMILVYTSKDKVTARILATAIVEIALYTWLFCKQIIKGKVFLNAQYWQYAIVFCVPMIPHYLSQMVLHGSDRIMIQKLVDDASAGIYSLAHSVSLLMTVFNTSLLASIEPWIYQQIKDNKTDKIRSVAYSSFIIIAFVNLLLMLFAPEIIRFFAPKQYHEAIWIIPPIAMSVYFMYSYSFFASIEFYYEKKAFITFSTTLVAILNIILNYVFIRKYGYQAAGYTTWVSYVVYALLHYCFMRKICVKELGGQIYSPKILVLISLLFVMTSFLILMTYKLTITRYLLAVIPLIAGFCYKDKLKTLSGNLFHM